MLIRGAVFMLGPRIVSVRSPRNEPAALRESLPHLQTYLPRTGRQVREGGKKWLRAPPIRLDSTDDDGHPLGHLPIAQVVNPLRVSSFAMATGNAPRRAKEGPVSFGYLAKSPVLACFPRRESAESSSDPVAPSLGYKSSGDGDGPGPELRPAEDSISPAQRDVPMLVVRADSWREARPG